MAIPRHPGDDDTPVKQPVSWRAKLLIGLIAALIVAFIALHLAGVFGPGG
jgi:hypothetical protein